MNNLENFLEACSTPNIDMKLLIEKQNWYNLIKNKNDLLQFLNAFAQHEIAKPFYIELLNFLFDNTYIIQTVFQDYSVEFPAVKMVQFLVQEASELALDINNKQLQIFIINKLLKKKPGEKFSNNFLKTIRNINDLDELILEFPEYDKQIIQAIFDDSVLYLQIFSELQDFIDFIQKYSSFKSFIIDEYIDYIQGIAWIEAGFINDDNLKTLFEIFDEDQKLKFIQALLSNKRIFNQISYSIKRIIQSLNLSVTITGKQYSVSGANLLIDYQYLHGSYPSEILARALFNNEKLQEPFKTQDVKIHLLSRLNKMFERESFNKIEIKKCLDIITTFYRNNPNWQDNKNLVNVLKSILMRLSFHPDIAGLKQLLLFNAIAKKDQRPNLPPNLREKLLQAEDNEKQQQELEKQQVILEEVKYVFKNQAL